MKYPKSLKCVDCGKRFKVKISNYMRERNLPYKNKRCQICLDKETNKMLQGGFQKVLKEFGL